MTGKQTELKASQQEQADDANLDEYMDELDQ